MSPKPESRSPVSAANSQPPKPKSKSPVSAGNSQEVLFFKDISLGPHEAEIRFRLIHFWEARNPATKTLIGVEMLLIDEQGTVIQAFIPARRVQTFLPHMRAGGVYKLINFYGSKSKTVYQVVDHSVTVSLSWNSAMIPLENSPIPFNEDRFRFHSHEQFEENCDLKGALFDVLGHMKLVNEKPLIDRPMLDEVEIATTRRVLVHVQSYGGPLMKLYLWDQAATDFCNRFKSSENTPTVLLVTTVNPKRLGGTLALTSMSSSRVFMDNDVQPSRDYLTWLESNPEIAEIVNADVVTKTETLTIEEIYSYIKQEDAKVAFFECTATIDDVVHGSEWYYIGCSACHTKATKGPTSLVCSKCGKANVACAAEYRAKISVYDNSEQAVFVLLGDAGRQLIGKKASELVDSYFESNPNEGVDHEVPIPQALIDSIGQTHKFCVKVSDHNITGKTRAITVTKIISTVSHPNKTASIPVGNSLTASDTCGTSGTCEDSADEVTKKRSSSVEPGMVKRPRHED